MQTIPARRAVAEAEAELAEARQELNLAEQEFENVAGVGRGDRPQLPLTECNRTAGTHRSRGSRPRGGDVDLVSANAEQRRRHLAGGPA